MLKYEHRLLTDCSEVMAPLFDCRGVQRTKCSLQSEQKDACWKLKGKKIKNCIYNLLYTDVGGESKREDYWPFPTTNASKISSMNGLLSIIPSRISQFKKKKKLQHFPQKFVIQLEFFSDLFFSGVTFCFLNMSFLSMIAVRLCECQKAEIVLG